MADETQPVLETPMDSISGIFKGKVSIFKADGSHYFDKEQAEVTIIASKDGLIIEDGSFTYITASVDETPEGIAFLILPNRENEWVHRRGTMGKLEIGGSEYHGLYNSQTKKLQMFIDGCDPNCGDVVQFYEYDLTKQL